MTHDASRRTGTDPLAVLRGKFPGWQAWRGVSGLLPPRSPNTSAASTSHLPDPMAVPRAPCLLARRRRESRSSAMPDHPDDSCS
jgi:hypothetical protein